LDECRCGYYNGHVSPPCFRVDSPSVIYERFDDEVIVINLDTGAYHSMRDAAADAFILLAEAATASELAEALAARYAATSEEILESLAPFLEQLQKERLITAVETRKPRAALRLPGEKNGLPFVAPTVDAYHDLESLLLLDPIHEVGDEGWPQASEPLAP
jgi:Coenzyme PQQ synthesis protein D (PqqD)